MTLGIPRFRVRSPLRDLERDETRHQEVRTAIEAAIQSVTSEFDGLERRVTRALFAASSKLENAAAYDERDPEDEKPIAENERAANSGLRRLDDLRAQRADYQNLLDALMKMAPKRPD